MRDECYICVTNTDSALLRQQPDRSFLRRCNGRAATILPSLQERVVGLDIIGAEEVKRGLFSPSF